MEVSVCHVGDLHGLHVLLLEVLLSLVSSVYSTFLEFHSAACFITPLQQGGPGTGAGPISMGTHFLLRGSGKVLSSRSFPGPHPHPYQLRAER